MLELVQVTKRFGPVEALKQVSFVLGPGVTAVVGPNGAGKSTLFHILTGRVLPTSGSVAFNGLPPAKIRAEMGFLAEEPPFYPYLTGEDQAWYFNSLRENPVSRDEVRAMLEKWGVSERKKIRDFSLGMRKRLGLACAFLGYPKFLILDEPFNGLDLEGQRLVEEEFASYRAQNKILIFSSHQLERVTLLADHLVLLRGGRLVFSGEMKKLAEQASRVIFYLSPDTPRQLLQFPGMLEVDERGSWTTVTVTKEAALAFQQHLAEHGVSPQGSQVLLPELKALLNDAEKRGNSGAGRAADN
ncbi:ABC transporter ATP-binding protein [Ammonifex thiophilus]|uniref:ABC transporter ATP-binding protein n=1 Tax=Ammonifex thiophilus TaxID=444093 RepID=A0A3D8P3T8_9THEO|nr:ABC transporter ATP-binding protein [Ammonifex thiophilus]RDV82045.1 ABC transporter ATP-binding protein [Ammonifex thiophilus]